MMTTMMTGKKVMWNLTLPMKQNTKGAMAPTKFCQKDGKAFLEAALDSRQDYARKSG